jgi:hypothetical protein
MPSWRRLTILSRLLSQSLKSRVELFSDRSFSLKPFQDLPDLENGFERGPENQ